MNVFRILLVSVTVICSTPSMAEKTYQHSEEHQSQSSSIPIPNGFRPEGIVRGFGSRAYVGSLANGSIYQVDLITGEGSLLVDNSDGFVVGLAYDKRTNYLYAAGGPSGSVYVYDAADGELKQTYQLTTDNAFINDGIITDDAAYFTNTAANEFYRIPLSEIGRLSGVDEVETIPYSGDFEFVEGGTNGNGIETTPDGENLIIVNTTTGKLYKVEPLTGVTQEIILDGGDLLIQGDGLLLTKDKLYVVQNRLNQVAEISLDRKVETGQIIRLITDDLYRVPTTITSYRNALFAINARFDLGAVDEDTDYDIVRTPLKH